MCKGLLANFLLSLLEVICLLVKDGELPFLVEEAGVTVLVGVFDAGFELFGVEIGDALEVGSIDFFLVLAALLPLLTELTCPK